MKPLFPFTLSLILTVLFSPSPAMAQKQQDRSLSARLQETPGLVALWDFKEEEGHEKSSIGQGKFPLQPQGDPIPRIAEGPLSGYSIALNGNNYLSIPYEESSLLNIKHNAVTVMAWIKWESDKTGFIGGMWNEYQDGGKRQYGLFVSLPHYNGKDQVCGHISKTGKPTPPFPYSIDYSASKRVVPKEKWVCVAFTYDGKYIRSFLNGVSETREPELIKNTTGFEGYPKGLTQRKNPYYYPDGMGNNGSDFTVGAVLVNGAMGNSFQGKIGGLAVFDRALSPAEMRSLAVMPD